MKPPSTGLLRRSLAVLAVLSCTTTKSLNKTGVISGPHDQTQATFKAVGTVEEILRQPGFWKVVEGRDWLLSTESGRAISGSEVSQKLQHLSVADLDIKVRTLWSCWTWLPFWNGSCNASTAACARDSPACGTINLNRDYVEDAPDAYLVNTVAHEMTHLLGNGTGPCGCVGAKSGLFVDERPRTTSHEAWLVSYTFGDLVQCFGTSAGDPKLTEQCLDGTLNGQPCDRRLVECCPSIDEGRSAAALTGLRAASDRCSHVKCPEPEEVRCGCDDSAGK